MSGIKTHTEDPISPAKGDVPNTLPFSPSVPISTTASDGYPAAQPGAAPTPTRTTNVASSDPPAPQPGAVPAPPPPSTTAKATLPPPPKAGEKPMPAEYYAPTQATATHTSQPLPYPPQMSYPPPSSMSNGIPPASTTSTSTSPSFPLQVTPSIIPPPTESSARPSLEHPPGYVQNPYASDMTPEQRFSTHQQEQMNQSGEGPVLGYTEDRRRTSNAGEDASAWNAATVTKWMKEKGETVGEQLGEVGGQVWESISGRK